VTLALASTAALVALVAPVSGSSGPADQRRQASAADLDRVQTSRPEAGRAKRATLGPAAAAARIQRIAARRWPATFAGVWLKRDEVRVAFTRRTSKRVGKLRRALGPRLGDRARSGLRRVAFADSLRSLESILARATAEREALPPISAPYDLLLSIRRNRVVAVVEQVTDRTRLAFRARYGEDVKLRQGSLGAPYACTTASCFPTLRSGLRSLIPGPDGGLGLCSTGFVVRHRGPVSNLILSAAHCGDADAGNPGAPRLHGTPAKQYGFAFLERHQGGVDAEVHKVSSSYDARKPYIYVDAATPAGRVYSYARLADLVEGQKACKSGAKTGATCGKVTSKYYVPTTLPPVAGQYMIRTDTCASNGDSGAGVYRPLKLRRPPPPIGYEAQGLLSGGASRDGVALPCADPAFFSFYSHIDLIDTALPVKVLRVRDLK